MIQKLYGIRFDGGQLIGTLVRTKKELEIIIRDVFKQKYSDFAEIQQDSIQVNMVKLKFRFNSIEFNQVVEHNGTIQIFVVQN